MHVYEHTASDSSRCLSCFGVPSGVSGTWCWPSHRKCRRSCSTSLQEVTVFPSVEWLTWTSKSPRSTFRLTGRFYKICREWERRSLKLGFMLSQWAELWIFIQDVSSTRISHLVGGDCMLCVRDKVMWRSRSDWWLLSKWPTCLKTWLFLLAVSAGCRFLTPALIRSVCRRIEPGRSSSTNSPSPSPTRRASAWSDGPHGSHCTLMATVVLDLDRRLNRFLETCGLWFSLCHSAAFR